MAKTSKIRHSPLDDAQVRCRYCRHFTGEFVFECPKTRALTVDCLKWCIYFDGEMPAQAPEAATQETGVKPQADGHGVGDFSARKKKRR